MGLRITWVWLTIVLVTSTKCCDEKLCNYGTAIGTQIGSSVAAVGGISCAFTFGVGCLVAAVGTIVAAGTTTGNALCAECGEGKPDIPLEKLDEILIQQKDQFANLNEQQLRDRLSRNAWFRRLLSGQQELLAGQAALKLNQGEILESINMILSKTTKLQSSINVAILASLYGDDIENLLNIQSLFKDMGKDSFGGIIDDTDSDDFLEFATHIREGIKPSSRNVVKMLTTGTPLLRQSIWEVDTSFCTKETEQYFLTLLYSSFVLRRIAMGMEGDEMNSREVTRFKKDLENIHNSFESNCACTGNWRRGNGNFDQFCYQVLGAEVYDDPQYSSYGVCKEDCEKQGGQLASVHSVEENNFIFGMLGGLNRGPPFRPTILGGGGVRRFCSFQCHGSINEDHWLDGSQFNFTNWDANEPAESGWSCMFIGFYSGGPKWKTGPCNGCDDCNPEKFDCACKKKAFE